MASITLIKSKNKSKVIVLKKEDIEKICEFLNSGSAIFRKIHNTWYAIWPQYTAERERKTGFSIFHEMKSKGFKIQGRLLQEEDCLTRKTLKELLNSNSYYPTSAYETDGLWIQTTLKEKIKYEEQLDWTIKNESKFYLNLSKEYTNYSLI